MCALACSVGCDYKVRFLFVGVRIFVTFAQSIKKL